MSYVANPVTEKTVLNGSSLFTFSRNLTMKEADEAIKHLRMVGYKNITRTNGHMIVGTKQR